MQQSKIDAYKQESARLREQRQEIAAKAAIIAKERYAVTRRINRIETILARVEKQNKN